MEFVKKNWLDILCFAVVLTAILSIPKGKYMAFTSGALVGIWLTLRFARPNWLRHSRR